MMKKILLLVGLLLTYQSWAQEETTALHTVSGNTIQHEFEVGVQTYLLADKVNVRTRPSSKATISVNLPIGTPITILRKSKDKLYLNGFRAFWYEVSFAATKGISKGYVWGGLIALGNLSGAGQEDVLFLYGIASVSTKKEEGYERQVVKMQVRACKNEKEASKVTFPSVGNLRHAYHTFSNYGNRGVHTIVDVLEYEESQEFCGGENPTTVLFWDGEKLHKVTTLYAVSDPPVFAFKTITYPNENGGIPYRLIVEEKEGWYEEETEKEVLEVHKKIACVWIKDELEEFKVLLDKKRE
ncbi:MAG: hypothetical protein ACRBFS_08705 [Aureispira sp.]